MKKRMGSILFLGVAAVVIVGGICIANTWITSDGKDSTPYEFPITVEDEEWAAFSSVQERLDACQIPQEKLENMTTEALLETVLNYPLINSWNAFNSWEDACNAATRDFNGFRELFTRDDVTRILEKKQKEIEKMERAGELWTIQGGIPLSATIKYLIICDEIQRGVYSGSTSPSDLY